MENKVADLEQQILKIAEGDAEFAKQLTHAIKVGLEELYDNYKAGKLEQNEHTIQQARHKVKPTLMMFNFDQVLNCLNDGMNILESEGFGSKFERHFLEFEQLAQVEIQTVSNLTA